MSSIKLICFMCPIVSLKETYKYVLSGVDVASIYKVARALRTKKASEVSFVLEAIYKKGGVFKYPKVFQCDNGSEFKSDVTNLLEKYNVDIQRATTKYKHTLTQLLWKPLTKSWQNCCLSPWMFKSFRTLKKYRQFGSKI